MKDRSAPARKLEGKVALVTGAGSGIGRATALALASEGARVVCTDLDLASAEETAASIVEPGSWSHRLDVSAPPAWEGAIGKILSEHGRLDVAVNCAGISHAAPVTEMDLEEWRRVMSVNLEGVFLGTAHAIRTMRRNASGGSIVNVSSLSGVKAQPGASAYCASKAAVIMFSKAAALECLEAGNGVRVNSISPAGVKTPMWRTMPFFQELMLSEGSEEAAFEAMAPAGKWASPEEVARAILYLASDESSFVTGTNLVFAQGDDG